MQFIFSTPVLIRHLWQLKTVVFLHQCLICAVLLQTRNITYCLKQFFKTAHFKCFSQLVKPIFEGSFTLVEFFDEKRQYCTYLGHLRQLNKNKNCPIGVLPKKVAKASRVLPVLGSLTEVEGSVQLTFLCQPVQISSFFILKLLLTFFLQNKLPYLEVKCTEPSPSVRIPWPVTC